jgi:DNA-binding MarR family transcriptional regulator
MKLRSTEARRILSFCLDCPFDVELSEQGPTRYIRISPLSEGAGQPRLFEAETFEEALRAAAETGLVRKECIERQIAFYAQAGERTFDARQGQWSGPAFPPAPDLDPVEVPGRELSLAHYRGLAEFRYQIRRFLSFSERAARAAGLEPPQHQLMLAIYGLPPAKRPNLPTLAERMCIEVEACGKLADELVDQGLLRWTANATDRRERLLALTEPGQTVLRKLTGLHRNQVLAVGPTFVQALGAILSSFGEEDP